MRVPCFIRVVWLPVLFLASNLSFAQFIAGPKAGFNTGHGNFGAGLSAGAIIGFHRIKISGDAMFYLPRIGNTGALVPSGSSANTSKQNFSEYNLNISFLFRKERMYLYPLAGLHILSVRNRQSWFSGYSNGIPVNEEQDVSKTDWGINFGGGALFQYDRLLSPFIEICYSGFSSRNSATISTGMVINIGGR